MKSKNRRPLRNRVKTFSGFVSPSKMIWTGLMAASFGATATASTLYDLSSLDYTQNFDAIGNSSTVNALPTGWGFNVGTTFLDALTDTTRGGGTTGSGALSGTSGGGAYVFVNGVLASGTDKAIGFLTSGSYSDNRNVLFGFTNNSGSTITSLSLSFDYEKYRSGTASRDWALFASDSDAVWGAAIISGGQSYASDAANTVVSNPPTTISKTVTINGLSLAVGANYYFRWNYDGFGTGSSGQALGIDNFSFTAIGGIPGRNLVWSPITGVWDLSVQNWTVSGAPGVPVAYAENDSATFDDTGLTAGSTVTIDAAGVTIGTIRVTNTTGIYTFVGGSLSGTGSVIKSGAGKLVLSSSNSYSGGTSVTGGTLSISDDSQLGAPSAPVSLADTGTLETTGSLILQAARTVGGTGTLKIAPSTTLNIAGPVTAGLLTFSNSGTLLLSGATAAQVGGLTFQEAMLVGATLPIVLGGPVTTTQTAGKVTISASLQLGASTRVFTIGDGSSGTDVTISGGITSTSASGRLHKLGDGTLELIGDNSGLLGGVRLGTAGIIPVNGGTLIIGSATSLGPGGAVTAGQFQFNAGTLVATAPIQFPSTLSVSIGNSAPLGATFAGEDVEFLGAPSLFRTGTASDFPPHIIITNSNVRLTGLLTGATTDLKISGTGSLTLVAGMTVTGDVSVEGSKFFTTGNIAGVLSTDNRPTITANLGATVGGSQSNGASFGQLIATGVAGNPGTISPGLPSAPIGAITTTALTVLPDGVVAIELGGVSTYDTINVNGAISLSGSLTLSLVNGYIPTFGDTFGIILNDDIDPVGGDGAFAGKAEGTSIFVGGTEFQISYVAGDGNDIFVTAVPEPGSAALLLGGMALIGFSRRRRA